MPIRPIRKMDRPHFLSDAAHGQNRDDRKRTMWSTRNMFLPKHSAYFASYFTITGLHGVHVLGGVLVFSYMMLPASTRHLPAQPGTSRQSR